MDSSIEAKLYVILNTWSVRIPTGPVRNSDQLQPVKKGDSNQPWTRYTIYIQSLMFQPVQTVNVRKVMLLCPALHLYIEYIDQIAGN